MQTTGMASHFIEEAKHFESELEWTIERTKQLTTLLFKAIENGVITEYGGVAIMRKHTDELSRRLKELSRLTNVEMEEEDDE